MGLYEKYKKLIDDVYYFTSKLFISNSKKTVVLMINNELFLKIPYNKYLIEYVSSQYNFTFVKWTDIINGKVEIPIFNISENIQFGYINRNKKYFLGGEIV